MSFDEVVVARLQGCRATKTGSPVTLRLVDVTADSASRTTVHLRCVLWHDNNTIGGTDMGKTTFRELCRDGWLVEVKPGDVHPTLRQFELPEDAMVVWVTGCAPTRQTIVTRDGVFSLTRHETQVVGCDVCAEDGEDELQPSGHDTFDAAERETTYWLGLRKLKTKS